MKEIDRWVDGWMDGWMCWGGGGGEGWLWGKGLEGFFGGELGGGREM